jgi:DNA topoisomerase-1
VRGYIGQRFGKDAVPDEPVVYKSKKGNVQDAHEAIRPTSTKYDPETVRKLLREEAAKNADKGARHRRPDQALSADLESVCGVADEASGLRSDDGDRRGQGSRSELRAARERPGAADAGLYAHLHRDRGRRRPARPSPPSMAIGCRVSSKGELLKAQTVTAEQHFTVPPPRFTEASLVKELEEKGIGRPSTYATILSTIQDRGYVEKKEGRFHPTDLGKRVNDLLVQSFPHVLNVDFTARMESDLDDVEDGQRNMLALLQEFYGPFKTDVEKATSR